MRHETTVDWPINKSAKNAIASRCLVTVIVNGNDSPLQARGTPILYDSIALRWPSMLLDSLLTLAGY